MAESPSAAPSHTWKRSPRPLSRSSVSSSTRRFKLIHISRMLFAPFVYWNRGRTFVETWFVSSISVAIAGRLVIVWRWWSPTSLWWGTPGQEGDPPPDQPFHWPRPPLILTFKRTSIYFQWFSWPVFYKNPVLSSPKIPQFIDHFEWVVEVKIKSSKLIERKKL